MQFFSKKEFCVLFFLGLLASASSILATNLYGPGISPDSIHYFHTALNLSSGKGYVTYNNTYFTMWPPLFPTILSFLSVAGDLMAVVRIFNAICFGLIVVFSGFLFSILLESKKVILLGVLAVAFSYPLFYVSVWFWSEPLFILLTLLFTIFLLKFRETQKKKHLILLSLFASLAFLQRYMGYTVVLTGLIVLSVNNKVVLKDRMKQVCVYLAISIMPILVWLTRNFIKTGMMTGFRDYRYRSYFDSAGKMSNILSTWFFPREIEYEWRLRLFVGFVFLLILIVLYTGKKLYPERSIARFSKHSPLIIFIIVYSISILLSVNYSANTISNRYLAQIYVFCLFLVLKVFDGYLFRYWKVLTQKLTPVLILSVVITLWFSMYVARVAEGVMFRMDLGAGGFNTKGLVNSEILLNVKNENQEGLIYSNVTPEAVYFITGKLSLIVPEKINFQTFKINKDYRARIKKMGKRLIKEDGILVWCSTVLQPDAVQIRDIKSTLKLKKIEIFKDGTIYRVEK